MRLAIINTLTIIKFSLLKEGVAMMKHDSVGRLWVQIPVLAKFFTGEISVKNLVVKLIE